MRRRLNQVAAAVGEGRELARQAAATTQAMRDELAAVGERQAALGSVFEEQAELLAALQQIQKQEREVDRQFRIDAIQGLRRVHADESWHRRQLREIRESPYYHRAYSDPEPLISVVLATYEHLDLLRSRTIPSILAQEYGNFEIVIVGDDASYGLADIIGGFEGAPIRFVNLPMRGPYPEDRERRWMASGTPALNEAMQLAKGVWIAPFADDDSMRPNHLRALQSHAREHQLEFVFGRLEWHLPDGATGTLGSFPPRLGDIGLQAALLHADLRIFELELADADFCVPNDWGQIERMLRAGVRAGMIDEVVADYYPSMNATWTSRASPDG